MPMKKGKSQSRKSSKRVSPKTAKKKPRKTMKLVRSGSQRRSSRTRSVTRL